MKELKRTLTREELHKLVWSTPIQKLAKQYGLSDRGFSKICQRHLVPVPPRGYWAKIEAGQPAKPTRLRPVKSASLQIVQITTKPVNVQSDYLAEIVAASKSAASQPEPNGPTLSVVAATVAASPSNATVKLHRDVAPFLEKLRSLKPDRDGFVNLRYVRVPPAAISRVGNFLSLVANDLRPYGFELHNDKATRLGFAKNGCVVDFGIDAPRKRVTNTSGGWRRQEYEHVGRLELTIYGRAEGSKKKWIDVDNRKIEDTLGQIIDSFLVNHVAEGEYEARRKVDEARRDHLARRRKLAELRVKREEDRLKFLRWLTEARQEVIDLRATIGLIPQNIHMPDDYQRMLQWAQVRLAVLEEQTTMDAVQSSLVVQKLFPNPDDLFDPEGDPPPKQNYWDD